MPPRSDIPNRAMTHGVTPGNLVMVAVSPVANCVKTRILTGPAADSTAVSSPASRQRRISPTNAMRQLAGVLPIGVLQQSAYQR